MGELKDEVGVGECVVVSIVVFALGGIDVAVGEAVGVGGDGEVQEVLGVGK